MDTTYADRFAGSCAATAVLGRIATRLYESHRHAIEAAWATGGATDRLEDSRSSRYAEGGAVRLPRWVRLAGGRTPEERRAVAFQIMMAGLVMEVAALVVLYEGNRSLGLALLVIGLVLAVMGFREARR